MVVQTSAHLLEAHRLCRGLVLGGGLLRQLHLEALFFFKGGRRRRFDQTSGPGCAALRCMGSPWQANKQDMQAMHAPALAAPSMQTAHLNLGCRRGQRPRRAPPLRCQLLGAVLPLLGQVGPRGLPLPLEDVNRGILLAQRLAMG